MSYPSVVKVFATTQDPDYDIPWQARPPVSGTGSGVVIGPGQVLTGAHVVANATFVQVQKLTDADKAVARVKAVCHDCDLALLVVDDEEFAKDLPAAPIAEFPHQGDEVAVVGFPIGGEEISITEGVVSRIEVQKYAHSQRYLLAATVDAAINAGNSGGPVFMGDEVAGIAFQKLEAADNIGEIVPAPLIRHFLEGIPDNRHQKVPGFGLATQGLENPRLRAELNMESTDSGVLVGAVTYGGSAWKVLKPRDVLLEVAGHSIANNGTVRYRDRYRTLFDVLLGDSYVGDEVEVAILREGRRETVALTLQPYQELVPRGQYDVLPSYVVYGGLVFQVLCRDLLATWDEWWRDAPAEFLHHYYSGMRTESQREIVVISKVLADEINVGYENFYNECVVSVNGHAPRDMQDFVRRLDQATGVVDIRTSRQGTIVLEAEAVREATPRILERYHILKDRSECLQGSTAATEPLPAASL